MHLSLLSLRQSSNSNTPSGSNQKEGSRSIVEIILLNDFGSPRAVEMALAMTRVWWVHGTPSRSLLSSPLKFQHPLSLLLCFLVQKIKLLTITLAGVLAIEFFRQATATSDLTIGIRTFPTNCCFFSSVPRFSYLYFSLSNSSPNTPRLGVGQGSVAPPIPKIHGSSNVVNAHPYSNVHSDTADFLRHSREIIMYFALLFCPQIFLITVG